MIKILSDEEVGFIQKIIERHYPTKPPAPFSFKAQSWKKWRQKFSRYVKALQERDPDIEDKHLNMLLMHLLGEPLYTAETFRILIRKGWTIELSLQTTIDDLSIHFRRVLRSYLYSRVNFNHRLQRQGETVADFLQAVTYLAETCKFPKTSYDILMRDKIVVGIIDEVARDKMIEYDDLLNYGMAVKIAFNQEVRHARLHGG